MRVHSHLRFLLVGIAIIMLGATASACAPSPTPTPTETWEFTVRVGAPSAMVTSFGGPAAFQQRVHDQLADISSRFTGMGGIIRFQATEFYTFTGLPGDQVDTPHPNTDFLIVYSDRTDDRTGWFGQAQSMMVGTFGLSGTVFDGDAADAATHELGHARGAVDLYALNVDPAKNPVNGVGYQAEDSIMTYPYGVRVWDAYNRNIIRKSADQVYQNAPIVRSSLPSVYNVQVTTANGAAVSGATIKVHPVAWFSGSVAAAPVQTGTTATSGNWQMAGNPFTNGAVIGVNWDTSYANFLVTATKGGQTTSAWLPISAAGNWFFSHPAGTAYELRLTLG